MRWFGFQASPKKISSTVTALIYTEVTVSAHERTPEFGVRRESSLMTLVSTRNVIESLHEGVSPILTFRHGQNVPLLCADLSQFCQTFPE